MDAGALLRAGGSTRPRADHIKGLRTLDPLGLVKATIEALLIRQAQAARDYEPDNDHSAGPDPVFKLYTGDQTSATVPPTTVPPTTVPPTTAPVAPVAPLPPTCAPVGGESMAARAPGDDDAAEEDPAAAEGVDQDAAREEEEDRAEDDA